MALVPTDINLIKVFQPEHTHIFLEEYSNRPIISILGDMQPGSAYRQNDPQQSGCQKCEQCKKVNFNFKHFCIKANGNWKSNFKIQVKRINF